MKDFLMTSFSPCFVAYWFSVFVVTAFSAVARPNGRKERVKPLETVPFVLLQSTETADTPILPAAGTTTLVLGAASDVVSPLVAAHELPAAAVERAEQTLRGFGLGMVNRLHPTVGL